MARRGIDMLPLLDVFMVVLFVFATIQEQQLDSSARELEQAKAVATAAEALAAQRGAELERARAARAQAEANAEANAERAGELEVELDELRRECGPRRPGGPACPAASAETRAQAEVVAVHERLRSKLAVVEVRLEGDPDRLTGRLRTRCCVRRDTPHGAWQACGEVPSEELERGAWFEAGADGLVDALRSLEADTAVVLLAQDPDAKFLASDDVADLLRERFPNLRVYDEGMRVGPAVCPVVVGQPDPAQPPGG